MYTTKNVPKITAHRIQEFKPQTEWFLRGPRGIHGIAHETRVLIISQIIHKGLSDTDLEISGNDLGWAAALHDTQRIDDDVDIFHGERSAVFTQNIFSEIHKLLPENIKGNIENISYLCRFHVPPDNTCPKMTDSLKAFKDADALDRWRIGDLDEDFLRLDISRKLTEISYILWNKTKHLGFDTEQDTFDEIVKIASDINILEK